MAAQHCEEEKLIDNLITLKKIQKLSIVVLGMSFLEQLVCV
jgi:hypothetical protein